MEPPLETRPQVDRAVREVLRDVLALPQMQVDALTNDSPLFGALPQLDSMAVAELFTALEDRLGFVIDDDEVDGDMLATFGALSAFVATKVG